MTESPVAYESAGEIGYIAVDNPPVNSLSAAVRKGLVEAIDAFAADASAEVAVLYCKGRTFIAGADISEFGKPMVEPYLPDVISRIESCAKPVIAVLHGTVLGGGLEVALGAHGRVAMPGTRIGLPEVTLGLMPGAGGSVRLPRLAGFAAAVDLITSGRQAGADEAVALGIIDGIPDAVDPRAAGEAEARRWIAESRSPRRISGLPAPRPEEDEVKAARTRVERSARGQIAPVRAFNTLVAALGMPFAEAMTFERSAFLDLMKTPQRAALIHAFFAERKVAQQSGLKGIEPRRIAKVGIIGGGTMGQGIAASVLNAGLDVTVIERDEEAAARAAAGLANMQQGAVKRGKLSPEACDQMLREKFRTAVDYAALADVDLVIEAVFESMDVKQEIFRKLDAVCRPGAVLATNTSYLDVDAIAAVTARPEDVIGLHFFSPANIMRLLEIVVADKTAPEVTATAFALAKALGKTGVRSGVCDGFIGNRMMNTYRTAADHMVLDGASPYDIDRALVRFGFAMGPYQVGDLAGLDIGYAARQRRAASRDPRERVPVFADRLVEAGRLGRKTGRGYYIYDSETPQGRPDPELEALLTEVRAGQPGNAAAFSDEEIVARYMAAMVNEGAKILEEGIAARPLDIDVVLLHGYGFPRWRGGPMHWADAEGLGAIAQNITRFAETDDFFWKISPLFARLAAEGRTFETLNTGEGA
ncbi:3-hydroxyacyl-CoA dehydrogenase NAD-binding domain-containing protein [Pannonibacter phragmitetus]|uniref:3-hydroxyacyl-CoA dehydrogenase NAD-binding domain-containing protein n=1 Tax=Pannonibacter phragmitetus TaxID=121719 RepID=UPI003D2F3BB1